jgi:outer membrane PBP1 activator LpoA protein
LFSDGTIVQLLGSTGALRLVDGGRFKRELAWGQVADRQLAPAPQTSGR